MSALVIELSLIPSVCLSVWRSVRSVSWQNGWIRIPFGVVSGVGRGMGVLDGGVDRLRGRGSFGGELERLIVTNG